ncbi:MAG: 50S ribosomal protein L22 [candidate division Zixibacteria bacterium]|nr:50S ribosomal protein L22 [candidate division Zixibacteria bacterium]
MEATAKARYLRGSARKMRRVAALVRGLKVSAATEMLRHVPKGAALPLAKVIKSAAANALASEGTAHHKEQDLVVADVRVDGGPIARRFRAVGMGRAYRIRKRYCHVRVVVSDQVPQAGRKRPRVAAAKPVVAKDTETKAGSAA